MAFNSNLVYNDTVLGRYPTDVCGFTVPLPKRQCVGVKSLIVKDYVLKPFLSFSDTVLVLNFDLYHVICLTSLLLTA